MCRIRLGRSRLRVLARFCAIGHKMASHQGISGFSDASFSRKIAGRSKEPGGAAIEDLEDPKAKAGRYLQKFERLDTTGSNLNNPSVIMSREKKTTTN